MAMSVSPGSRSSPGFCHIRRQGNRSAQKQIICPIYRGWPVGGPTEWGWTKILAPKQRSAGLQGLRSNSFLQQAVNPAFPRQSGGYRAAESAPFSRSRFAPGTSQSRQHHAISALFGRRGQRRLRIRRRQHEIGDARHDLRAETRTVEHAVMADALLHVVHPAIGRESTSTIRASPRSGRDRRCRPSRLRPSSAPRA